MGHLSKGMLVQKNTGSLWRKKRKEMPLQTHESSEWLWFIHKAHNGSKFPIRACLSLTHVCTCRYTSHLSCGKLKTSLSLASHHTTLDFDESHFQKENFKTHRNLPLSGLLDLAGACGAAAASRTRRPTAVQGGPVGKGQGSHGGCSSPAVPRCPGTRPGQSTFLYVWSLPVLFKVKEMKHN